MTIRSVGVIGAGNIGVGVVTDLVLHEIKSVVVDLNDTILQHAKAEVIKNVRFAPVLSKALPRLNTEEVLERMTLTSNLNDVSACDFIIENITEDWHTKKELYGQLERLVPSHVCFAANTSCI